ncbi:MAG: outer membrane beta-barrel protein [Ignavibacteriaceae bacterium]|jgi:hypothetical protein
MKKYVLCFLVLVFSSSSFAQFLQGYGFKIGYVSSRQDYTFKIVDDLIEWKSGFSVSVYADLFSFNNFSISPELKYIQKGWRGEFVSTGPESPEPIGKEYKDFHHNYLSIPISLKYSMDLIIGKTFIKIAPRYDIRLKSYDDFDSPSSTYKDFKNVFGGTLSLGFMPKLDIGLNPFVEISYHLDFTNSFSIPNNSIKNRAIEISLGTEF